MAKPVKIVKKFGLDGFLGNRLTLKLFSKEIPEKYALSADSAQDLLDLLQKGIAAVRDNDTAPLPFIPGRYWNEGVITTALDVTSDKSKIVLSIGAPDMPVMHIKMTPAELAQFRDHINDLADKAAALHPASATLN